MPLPPNFQFSQASLQDFVDCRRRFYLRYIEQLAWPAAQSEPLLENERAMLDGARFHRLVHQYLLGISTERLSRLEMGENLRLWWENFISAKSRLVGIDTPGYHHLAEYSLSAPLADYRLVAKYDLVAVGGENRPSRLWIYDWKTSRFRTRRSVLASRLQTRVYPFLLARAGKALNQDQPIHPEQIEMVFWFAGFPEQPEPFPYSLSQFRQDQDDLTALIQTIARLADKAGPSESEDHQNFPLTSDVQKCAICVYRSLCDRGQRGGESDLEEGQSIAELTDLDLDFDQIAELEF